MHSTRVILFDQPVRYTDGVRLQERLVALRIADRIGDTLLMLEHHPVVTLGARGRTDALLQTQEQLAAADIDLVHASRGGDVTYHGPGQLVMYPILRLGGREADSHGYLCNLEEVSIRTAADFGVEAFRRAGMTGAWTADGKIAAIGIRLRRWVTFHGTSFNVDVDLAGFRTIVPCGLSGEAVTSLASLLGDACPPRTAVRDRLIANFSEICQREPGEVTHCRDVAEVLAQWVKD